MGTYNNYLYKGEKRGKVVQGFKKAISKEELALRLTDEKITLQSCKKVYTTKNITISIEDICLFSKQMGIMLKNGINSTQALQFYIKYTTGDLKYILLDVLRSLEQGHPLSTSLRKNGFFTTIFCETVTMGEESSKLAEAFEYVRIFYERELQMKRKIKSMAAYPVIVLVIAFIATIVMSTLVMPKFADVYAGFGSELPMITTLYIRFGEFIVKGFPLIAIGIFVTLKVFTNYKKNIIHRKNLDRFKLHIPIVCKIYKSLLVARFCNILSLYMKSGITIQKSLPQSSKILQNSSLNDEFIVATETLLAGNSFSQSIDNVTIFPPFFKQVVFTGQESGGLTEALANLSVTMQEEADNTINDTTANVNQFIMIFLFAAIGPMFVAILLPMLNLTSAASGAAGL